MPDTIEKNELPVLKTETYDKAKEVASSYGVYYLEKEWQAFWEVAGKPHLHNADAAFIAFCKKRYDLKPSP